jgi:hypothetical protein
VKYKYYRRRLEMRRFMVTLDHIIEEAEQLSDDDIKAAYKRIEQILDTRAWEAIWKNPKALLAAQKLEEESRDDEVEDGGFDNL